MCDPDSNDNDKGKSWELREIAPAAGCILLLLWALAVFAPMEWSTRLSNAGQAVGFIASAVAIYTIVIALRQLDLQQRSMEAQLRDRDQHEIERHADAERAHWDKLADAYTKWFEGIRLMIENDRDEVATAMRHGGSEWREALKPVYAHERIIRVAAAPVLMLERRPAFRDRISKIGASLPSWQGPVKEADLPAYREHVSLIVALLSERLDDLESIFTDVALAARAA